MNIEYDLFKKYKVDFSKLEQYGFIKKENNYVYSNNFFDNNFKCIIKIDIKGNLSGKVIDLDTNLEYTNIRVENAGSYVNKVKELYKEILIDIRSNCFNENYFVSSQANIICDFIINTYKDSPEFLWDKFPNFCIFRNSRNNKWYALIANVKGNTFNREKDVEIINVKVNEKDLTDLLKIDGINPAYHMNKKSWITILLDGTVNLNKIKELVNSSYDLINEKNIWIIPANSKYYDIKNCFNDTDTIIWKQSTKIEVGDIVYMYVASPISSILYKCSVIETNIPYDYHDVNLSINKVMKIKLLKKYKEGCISFKNLNDVGIKMIRGPIKITNKIEKIIDKKG